MAVDVADLRVKIGVDGADSVQGDLNRASGSVESFAKKAGKIGAGLSLGLTTPLIAFGKQAISAASDLAESQSKVGVVFGQSANAINAWAQNSATAIGMSQQQALEAAGTYGNLFTAMGIGQKDAAGLSTQVVGLAADLASFNNASPEETLLALRSGLTGEYEPLKRFGIAINEAAVKQKGLELGLTDANGEMSEQNKILARNALIMDQTKNAQGDFARTSGGLANQQRILRAQLGNLAASMGTVLLPMVTKIIASFARFAAKLASAPDWVKKLAAVFALLAAAAGPALVALAGIATVLGLLSAPLLIAIALVGLLALALGKNLFGVRDKLESFGKTLGNIGKGFLEAFKSGNAWNESIKKLPEPLQRTGHAIASIGDSLGDLWRSFQDRGWAGAWNTLINGGEGQQILTALGAIGDEIASAAKQGAAKAIDFVIDVVPKLGKFLWEAGSDLLSWLGSKIGFNQPGTVGDGTGGPDTDQKGSKVVDFVIDAAVKLGRWIWESGGSLLGWLDDKLNIKDNTIKAGNKILEFAGIDFKFSSGKPFAGQEARDAILGPDAAEDFGLGAQLKGAVEAGFQRVKDLIDVKALFKGIFTGSQDLGAGLHDAIADIPDLSGKLVSGLKTALGLAESGVIGATALPGLAAAVTGALATAVATGIAGFTTGLISGKSSGELSLGDILFGKGNQPTGLFDESGDQILGGGQSALSELGGKIVKVIADGLDAAKGELKTAGQKLLGALLEGLVSGWTGVQSWLNNKLDAVRTWYNTIASFINKVPGVDPLPHWETGAEEQARKTRERMARDIQSQMDESAKGQSGAPPRPYKNPPYRAPDEINSQDRYDENGVTPIPDTPTTYQTGENTGAGRRRGDTQGNTVGFQAARQTGAALQAVGSQAQAQGAALMNPAELQKQVSAAQPIAQKAIKLFDDVATEGVGFNKELSLGVSRNWDDIGVNVSNNSATMARSAIGNAEGMNSGVTGAAGLMAAGAISAAGEANSGVVGHAKSMQDGATGAAGAMNSGVTGQASSMSSAAIGEAFRMASGVIGIVQALAYTLSGFDLSGAGYSLGASLGQGMVAGINSQAGAVAAAAANLAAVAESATAGRAKIASPSKVFIRLGQFLPQGMAIGINRGAETVRRAAEAMTAGAISAGRIRSYAGAALAQAGPGQVIYIGAGAYVGEGATRELRQMATEQSTRVIDRRVNGNRLGEAR